MSGFCEMVKQQNCVEPLYYYMEYCQKILTTASIRHSTTKISLMISVSDSSAAAITIIFKIFRLLDFNSNEMTSTDKEFLKCGFRLLQTVVRMKMVS